MSAVDYRAEARADKAAVAEQRRQDAAAAEQRRAARQLADDERAARLAAQQAADKARRKEEKASWRREKLTPQNVYRTGTLGLVVASGLASLPAQVMHFVEISPMLLPLPLALEGAAWVMAAGVAFADARQLAARVRWMLRAFVVAAAGFAAWINYGYGSHLDGLTPAQQTTAGVGLAAVTLLGPLLFEIRQWVSTLAADEDETPDARARRRHARLRRRHHRAVARTAGRLLSAAPVDSLTEEDAWARAWEIEQGADEPGMTPDLVARRVTRTAAYQAAEHTTRNSKKKGWFGRNRSTPDLHETPDPAPVEAESAEEIAPAAAPAVVEPVDGAAVVNLPKPVPAGFLKSTLDLKPVTSRPSRPARALAAESTRPARRVTHRVPDSARTRRPTRTLDQLLAEARTKTADWSTADLTAEAIRRELGTGAARARQLRDTLHAERSATAARAGEAA
ncbi:hypothetical protein [Streptomyces sp. BI87]|uniref:hypothetical protein n=1 Tax=Streptomyces sp. BI87 TaxID=2987521 RepID=UPI0022216A48|nr:hypothetical protein [Streptomyces sp. BI87]UYX94233.1 hypothetical protein OIM89_11015 [Streptomyces sp. BI87]